MSERTAMRTLPNLAVRRSPWPSLARPGIARERGRRRPTRSGDDEPVVVEPGHGHVMDLDRPAAEGVDRPASGRQLAGQSVGQRAAFPGDEDPAGGEQRKRQLDELAERGHGPGGDGRPAAAMAPVEGEGFGPDGGRLDRAGQPVALAAADRKAAFLATGSRSRARAAGSATAIGIPG